MTMAVTGTVAKLRNWIKKMIITCIAIVKPTTAMHWINDIVNLVQHFSYCTGHQVIKYTYALDLLSCSNGTKMF